jgi:hypothetical protein
MTRKLTIIDDAKLRAIGRNHGSESVRQEAALALKRWDRDINTLAEYGHGKARLELFRTTVGQHLELCTSRPLAVSNKKTALKDRDAAIADGWRWVDKIRSMLEPLARSHDGVAERFNAAMPADDTGLEAGVGALATVIDDFKDVLPEDANVATRLAEAPKLQARLHNLFGDSANAKAATVQDSAELDILDGKIYLAIRDLNQAARRAIRNGDVRAEQNEYRFHYLRHGGRPVRQPDEAEPT